MYIDAVICVRQRETKKEKAPVSQKAPAFYFDDIKFRGDILAICQVFLWSAQIKAAKNTLKTALRLRSDAYVAVE